MGFFVRPLGALRGASFYRRLEACFPCKAIRDLKGFNEWALLPQAGSLLSLEGH